MSSRVLETLRPRTARGQIILLTVVVVLISALLSAGYYFGFRIEYKVLFSNLRTRDAATIVAELDRRKVEYKLAEGGQTILVPADVADATRLEVMGSDLPLQGTVGFELFNRSDMGLTEFAQHINYQRALQGELARTIMTLDTVEAARVHLTLPAESVFRGDRRPPKASVTLVPRRGQTLSGETVTGIRRLVAASVPDLQVNDVVVIDDHGASVSDALVGAAPVVSPSLQTVRAIETFYAARVRQAIAPVRSDAAVEVVVPAQQWNGAADDFESNRDVALSGWTPTARTFRLEVRIAIPRSTSAEDRAALFEIATAAVSSDGAPVDLVTLSEQNQPSAETVSADPLVRPAAPHAAQERMSPSGVSWPFMVLLACLFVAGGALLAFRGRLTGRMTEAERAAFVRRLKAQLEAERSRGVF